MKKKPRSPYKKKLEDLDWVRSEFKNILDDSDRIERLVNILLDQAGIHINLLERYHETLNRQDALCDVLQKQLENCEKILAKIEDK